jgi:hypothetical protein
VPLRCEGERELLLRREAELGREGVLVKFERQRKLLFGREAELAWKRS